MASPWLLKIPCETHDHVLVQVTRHGSDLDLNLLATEGEAPYKCKIRQRKLKDLRAKTYDGTEEEWADVLRYVLFPKDAAASMGEDERRGLEVVADVSGQDTKRILTITLRNRVGEITQRLGSILLTQTEDEIQLFDWTCQALDRNASLEADYVALKAEHQRDQANISSLQAQLVDFLKAKAEDEDQLISKFVLLLNEKKLKIRNQQRILRTANIDEKKLRELQSSTDGKHRKPDSSRARKRRAGMQAEDYEAEEQDSSDGFETMDIDPKADAGNQLDAASDLHTTTTETESEDGAAPLDLRSTSPAAELAKSSTPEPARVPFETKSPPPPRTLPFVRKPNKVLKDNPDEAPKKAAEAALGSDEETASDDDEL